MFLKQNPNIKLHKVVKEGDPGNEFYQAVASGTAPDFINVSFTQMDKLIAGGVIEPLNKYTDKWSETKHFDKQYMDMFKKNDNYYGLPSSVAPMLFGYNKDLFKKAGLEGAPKTWDDALEAAKKLNNPDKSITGYGTLAAEWTEWFFQYYVWQAGGDLTARNDDGTAKLTFTDPAVIKAAKYYQELAKNKVIQSDRTLKFNDLIDNFARGKIAMMPFATDWVKDVVNKGMDIENLGLAVPPAGPSGKSTSATAGGCWVINAKTSQAKKDAAWKYIKFSMSKGRQEAYYDNLADKGALAPITLPRTDMKITDFGDFPKEYEDVLAEAAKESRLEFYGKADFGSYVDRAVQKVLANPNADAQKEFQSAQDLATKEALPKFDKANKID